MKSRTRRRYPDLATWRGDRFNQMIAAEKLGMTQSNYSKLERRVIALRGQRAKQVSAITGVPVEVLVGAV